MSDIYHLDIIRGKEGVGFSLRPLSLPSSPYVMFRIVSNSRYVEYQTPQKRLIKNDANNDVIVFCIRLLPNLR